MDNELLTHISLRKRFACGLRARGLRRKATLVPQEVFQRTTVSAVMVNSGKSEDGVGEGA